MALKLDILANTRQLVSEMKKSGASVEDVSDALDDMARDGKDAGEDLERSFRDLTRASDTAGRKVGRNLDDGFDKARKGVHEFKSEANSTAREAAASFDGSAQSIGDAFQETAANALAGFGPLGAAAGLGIAAAIGAGTAALDTMKQASDDLKKSISDMYQEAAEEGRDFLSGAQIQQEATRLLFEDRERLMNESKSLGVDIQTLALAYAGDQQAVNDTMEIGNSLLAERDKKARENLETLGAAPHKVDLQAESIRNVLGLLEQQQKWHEADKKAAQDVLSLSDRRNAKLDTTKKKLQELVQGKYVASLDLNVRDNTAGEVDRIVRRINGKVASIQISAGINGRSLT